MYCVPLAPKNRIPELHSASMIVVSVDGGATKTMAICYDIEGNILGMAASGPSNFRNIGVEKAGNNISEAVKKSVERAGYTMGQINRATYALAGVGDSIRSTEIIREFISDLHLTSSFDLFNDGEAGFNCRLLGRDGIIIAAGTGLVAIGRLNGGLKRVSGWGWLMGDEGSAFYIGRKALQEAACISDGRQIMKSRLLEEVERFFHTDEPRGITNHVYTTPVDVRKIASLARLVSDLAKSGDEVCRLIISDAALQSATCAKALLRESGDRSMIPVSGYGGVFRSGELYWDTLIKSVMTDFPEIEPVTPLYGYHAVLGSMFMVMQQSGIEFDQKHILEQFNNRLGTLSQLERKDYLFI